MKKFIKKYKSEIDSVSGFLFIAAVFYTLYFAFMGSLPLLIWKNQYTQKNLY